MRSSRRQRPNKSRSIRAAEAARISAIEAAQAKAEESRLVGAGERQRREELAKAAEIEGRAEGAAEQARREAIAAAVRAEGDADASAILAKGEAEAEAMAKKATAYEQYGEAAIIDLLARMLPDVIREASAPMAGIDKMTVISTEGASGVTRQVAGNVTQGMQLASDLVGVDLGALFSRLAGGVISDHPQSDTSSKRPVAVASAAGSATTASSDGELPSDLTE